MTTTRVSPTQVQANGYVYVFEDDEEADDFQACTIGVDMAYCEFEHAVISKVPLGTVHHFVRSWQRTGTVKCSLLVRLR